MMKSFPMARKLFIWCFMLWGTCQCSSESYQHKSGINESTRIFSPRMDYDEWTPLGRGDPLKNDPTFDYVPPVLERVQYWLGDTQTTEPSSKRDVLVLGVTAKKTSPQIPEHFLKFMDTPKHPPTYLTRDFTGSTGAEPPKPLRTTKFRSPLDFKHPTKGHYPSHPETSDYYYPEKQKPYTVMLPPPLYSVANTLQFGLPQSPQKKSNYDSNDEPNYEPNSSTTSSSISFEKSNLIYHQSSHQALDWPPGKPLQAFHRPIQDNYPSNSPSITWPGPSKEDSGIFERDHHHAASMNHEIVVGPNANIIVDAGDSGDAKEMIVVGHKSPDLNMSVILANTSTTPGDFESRANVTVSVVMPTNYKDTTKSISRGTEVHLGTTFSSSSSSTSSSTSTSSFSSSFVEMSATTPFVPSTTVAPPPIMDTSWQQDQAPPPMFPMRAPPKIYRRPGFNHRPLFGGRPMGSMMMFSNEAFRPTTIRSTLGALLQKEATKVTTPTTTTTTSTTTPSTTLIADSFTTDPIFSHYKQPAAPLHGPPYLIIQGHSKVKTYKPTISKHGVPLPMETTLRPISKFEQFVNENTRRMEIKTTTEGIRRENKNDSLLNLVQKGVSAFTIFNE
ncbi:uncharacterized protein [Fopius arisanus]|uniref:Uncharacterized protein n=2 Tax=Fopius arisanus TaxID=64838 RepID=A0A9R1U380_9HYME|nr:PREDICTED: uncharacterized protein LOC105268000 [Fopius arisanus]